MRLLRSEEHTSELQSLTNLVCRIIRSEEHTSELQSLTNLVCRLLLEKKNASKALRHGWSSGGAMQPVARSARGLPNSPPLSYHFPKPAAKMAFSLIGTSESGCNSGLYSPMLVYTVKSFFSVSFSICHRFRVRSRSIVRMPTRAQSSTTNRPTLTFMKPLK